MVKCFHVCRSYNFPKSFVKVNLSHLQVIVLVLTLVSLFKDCLCSLKVSTKEYTPLQGGDCSTGMCNITITVQLTDINDNDPVFDNSSYRLTVRNNVNGAVIEMVSSILMLVSACTL